MAEQIIQKKKKKNQRGVGKDSYLGVFLETAVKKFLDKNYIFRKILEKYLLKSFHLKMKVFHDFVHFLGKPILSYTSEWLLRDNGLHLLVNQPSALQ